MLTKLLGNDVTRLWPLVSKAIDNCMDRDVLAHGNTKERILRKILEGRISCWLSQGEDGVHGIVMTVIIDDDLIGGRSLLVYMMSTLGRKAKAAEFMEGMEKLTEYARSIKCSRFIFYTKNQKLLNVLKYISPGVHTDYTMAVMDI